MKHLTGLKHAAAILLVALAPHAFGATAIDEERAEARQLYDEGRWSLAWERFAALADRDDLESARMVLRMTRFGPQLFQQSWTPSAERMARWRVVATSRPVHTAATE